MFIILFCTYRKKRRNSYYSRHHHRTEVERSSHADADATTDAEAGEDLTDLEREGATHRRKGEGRGGGPAAGRHAGSESGGGRGGRGATP